jgi:hypothetical protein
VIAGLHRARPKATIRRLRYWFERILERRPYPIG